MRTLLTLLDDDRVRWLAIAVLSLLFLLLFALLSRRRQLRLTKVKVTLPFQLGEAEWEPSDEGRDIAWQLYIELITRISTQPLKDSDGVLREALASLYTLYRITRRLLKDAGPDIGSSENSTGGVAVTVLNKGLRAFLTKWHAELLLWEQQSTQLGSITHERAWSRAAEMRLELESLRQELITYARVLKGVVDAQPKPSLFRRVLRRLRNWTIGYDFFISYSRGQTEPKDDDLPAGNALSYAVELEQRLLHEGFACFRDDSELAPGVPVSRSVFSAVNASRAMIAIASKDADKFILHGRGQHGWVYREICQFQSFGWTSRPILALMRLAGALVPIRGIGISRILPIAFFVSEWDDISHISRPIKPDVVDLFARLGVNQLAGDSTVVLTDSFENLSAGVPGGRVIEDIKKHVNWIRVNNIGRSAIAIAATTFALIGFVGYRERLQNSAQQFVERIEQQIPPDAPLINDALSVTGVLYPAFVKHRLLERLDTTDGSVLPQQRATNGAMLALVDPDAPMWQHLSSGKDPELRTFLFRRMATSGMPSVTLVQRLSDALDNPNATDPGLRQALILCLGRFDDDHLPPQFAFPPKTTLDVQLKRAILSKFELAYCGSSDGTVLPDPDPGVHSAIAWCLLRWCGREYVYDLDVRLATSVRSESRFFKMFQEGKYEWDWFVTQLPACRTMIVLRTGQNGLRPACAISSMEETYRQLHLVYDATHPPYTIYAAGENTEWRPVRGISWHDASAYCAILRSRMRLGYELPNEAEWELAAAGRTPSVRFFGDALELANEFACIGKYMDKTTTLYDQDYDPVPQDIGMLMPNQSGFFDTLGNVQEFCSDVIPNDKRVVRGDNLQTTDKLMPERNADARTEQPYKYWGFRIAIDLQAASEK